MKTGDDMIAEKLGRPQNSTLLQAATTTRNHFRDSYFGSLGGRISEAAGAGERLP